MVWMQERPGFFADDGFAAGDFLLALLEIVVRDGLQVVDVVEINVIEEIHLRLDVARDGDIN